MLKILKISLQLINVVILLALLSVHFIFKEHSYRDSLHFYTFPLPVIILVVLLFSIILTKPWRRFNLTVASLLLVIWFGRSFKIHIPETVKETDLEIVFWNASRAHGFETAFKVNKAIPDVMVLVESKKNNIKALQTTYPNHYFYKSKGEMYVFSKTPINIKSENASNYSTTVLHFTTAELDFYAVDVTGSPDVPREWELTYVNRLIKKDNNSIVLGDFNVPYESRFLNPLKATFNHAFSKKGNGFRETWFYNLPLLSLDHIWVSKDLEILKTEKITTFKSDHTLLKTFIKKDTILKR